MPATPPPTFVQTLNLQPLSCLRCGREFRRGEAAYCSGRHPDTGRPLAGPWCKECYESLEKEPQVKREEIGI